ncbi:hypothetical protein LOK49_LG04G00411 [Camellia lanceoleosa]|uniref:Uncharacterized protein n=1 Tax=Camellia lanceoleosa TaxID=1840588 RepID=A0ACC0I082_9ERIC|nr:hypothetical protein LOK49_LG04G00411 [Camellia lanceoleosa]
MQFRVVMAVSLLIIVYRNLQNATIDDASVGPFLLSDALITIIDVIKPSVVGGFENAALIARWAQQQGKMSVVKATFESSLGLSAYVQFSYYLELQKAVAS